MGMPTTHLSSSTYDTSKCPTNYGFYPPNPNPKNFKIIRSERFGKFLMVEVMYPDCKNFEGRKIMVYFDTTVVKLKKQGSLDPHFSDNKNYYSPIARFIPNTTGWLMGTLLCKSLNVKQK